jgi:hypothetical protein
MHDGRSHEEDIAGRTIASGRRPYRRLYRVVIVVTVTNRLPCRFGDRLARARLVTDASV